MPRKEANPYDQAAHAETTTPERQLIVLGMWTREMRARGESVSAEWARESYAAASRLKRRQTYNVTAIALGQEPGKNALAITRRFADRTPLTPVKGCPVMEGEAESPELEDRIRVWRRAVTYQWLLLGRKIEERLKSNTPIDDAWVDAETRAAEEGTPESAQDRARRELEALGVEDIELEDCPIAVVEIDENGPRHALPAGVRWYPTSRLTALRAEKGHLVVCGPGHGAAMRSGTGNGWAIRLGTGHGDAVRKDTGHGGALRAGPGHGHARRMDTGDGDAVRIGSGAGHAEHTSLGDGDAIRDGDGPGEAYGGRTARRSGAGPGCSRGEIHAAVREGSGPGTVSGSTKK